MLEFAVERAVFVREIGKAEVELAQRRERFPPDPEHRAGKKVEAEILGRESHARREIERRVPVFSPGGPVLDEFVGEPETRRTDHAELRRRLEAAQDFFHLLRRADEVGDIRSPPDFAEKRARTLGAGALSMQLADERPGIEAAIAEKLDKGSEVAPAIFIDMNFRRRKRGANARLEIGVLLRRRHDEVKGLVERAQGAFELRPEVAIK